MNPRSIRLFTAAAVAVVTGNAQQSLPNVFPLPNASGLVASYNIHNAPIGLNGAFFQPLGTNGRSCATCHLPGEGWSFSTVGVQLRFLLSQGKDPIFRPNDGANCDHDINTSTLEGRRRAYSLLLQRGLIRVAIPMPAGAEFTITNVKNPYGCNETANLSMYRRPLPSTNLNFLSTLMWDGRESTAPSTQKIVYPDNGELLADLAHQAVDATTGHAQGSVPTAAQVQDIVNFEMSLRTAQIYDYRAGLLTDDGATGGPVALGSQEFFVGINDSFPASFGFNPKGTTFDPNVFQLFSVWLNSRNGARASIARGEGLFRTKPITIAGVAGINDVTGLPTSFSGTCGTCHDTPNIGNHSISAPLNIGVSDVNSPLDTSYLPVFTLVNNATHATVKTTDPGRALITGKWSDVGKLKGPILRGLASRAPYFHNGSANSLADVLLFYEKRFNIVFTPQERADLVAFLNAL